jgi:hypothetical protein
MAHSAQAYQDGSQKPMLIGVVLIVLAVVVAIAAVIDLVSRIEVTS